MSKTKGQAAAQDGEMEQADAAAQAPAQLPVESDVIDFGADVGRGQEGTDRDSFAIPFLRVLQKGSPQCDETTSGFMPEARQGMLYNSVTQELYDGKTGLIFLPCVYQRRFLRWGPRGGEGQGFKGEIMPEAAAMMRETKVVVEVDGRLYFPMEGGEVNAKKCDRLVDTRNHFGLIYDPDDGLYERVLLSLVSTQIKKSKQMMSIVSAVKVNGKTPPTWYNKIRITSVPESNDQGSWFGYRFANEGGITSQEVYGAAREFYAAVIAGDIEVKIDDAQEDVVGEGKF